jgi:hypothetical protein
MNNNLLVYILPENKNIISFVETDNLVLTSPFENHPLFCLGYHQYINRTRENKIIETKKFETKKELFYVVNQFEVNIDNYEDSVNNISKIYLKQEIKSIEFYKLWEIFFIFNVVDKENQKILIINDNNEEQAVVLYRNKFFEKISKKDKIYKKYELGIKADLIISHEKPQNENTFIEILIDQIKKIIETQQTNGNLILRVYDTFTLPTIKLLYLITSLYKRSYLYKPFFSRPSDSEKYIICKNFDGKNTTKIINCLEKILTLTQTNNFISDIFLDMNIPQDFLDIFKFTNIKLVNQEQIIDNEIIKYIQGNNYFGDKYHEYKNYQIEATNWWKSIFYPPSNNLYIENKKKFNDLLDITTKKNNLEKEKFINQLV